jgi:hypothetical protein
MATEIKYAYPDDTESTTVKERRITISRDTVQTETVSLRDLEQELENIARERQYLDDRESSVKSKLSAIGSALSIDVAKEVPKMAAEDIVKPLVKG